MDLFLGLGKNDRSVDVAGIAAAILLVLVARALLPRQDRHRARLPVIYLGVSLAFGALSLIAPTSSFDRAFAFFYTFFLLASSGRSLVLLAVDVAFGRRTQRPPPRIFRDVSQAVVYVVVIMLTLHAVGVEPGSLLTTSALLTAVIGLSLQDTLGNMVSGLALQMQRPFEVGDFIQFDADARQIGQVTEVNWRATTVMTNDLVEVIVPNGVLAKSLIRNYSRPSTVSRRIVTVQGPYATAPKRTHEAILSALAGTAGVLAEPAPYVQTRNFADSGIEYAVCFYTDDFASRDRIDGNVRDRVWYALQRAGIDIPFPTRMVHTHAVSEESERRAMERELSRRDQVLRCVDFLNVLAPEVHRALAAGAVVRLYAPGEVIVAKGDASKELFIIDRGSVAIELPRPNASPVVVKRLAAGTFFGEMGLMTGEVRAATVRAEEDCSLLVVDHDAFRSALSASPGVVDSMSDLLARRQAEIDAHVPAAHTSNEPHQERSKRLISQIRDFFKV